MPGVNHCRAFNKRADAASGSVSASFQEEISAVLVQHHSAAGWASRLRRRMHNLSGKCFSTMALLVVERMSETLVVGNYGVLTILFIISRLMFFIVNDNLWNDVVHEWASR